MKKTIWLIFLMVLLLCSFAYADSRLFGQYITQNCNINVQTMSNLNDSNTGTYAGSNICSEYGSWIQTFNKTYVVTNITLYNLWDLSGAFLPFNISVSTSSGTNIWEIYHGGDDEPPSDTQTKGFTVSTSSINLTFHDHGDYVGMYEWYVYGYPLNLEAPVFINSTPNDDDTDNTNLTINFTYNTSDVTELRYWLYMDTNANPITPVVSNQSSDSNYYNWTMNLTTDGTYYYKVQVFNVTTGEFTINSSIRTFILDVTDPTITLNSNSFFQSDNSSTLTEANLINALFNFTFTDNADLFAFTINITNTTNSMFYNLTNISLTGTETTIAWETDLSGWAEGYYIVNVTVWDSHTKKDIPNYNIKKSSNYIEYDNQIKIITQGAKSSHTSKKKDRYSFGFEYDNIGDRVYLLESESDLEYIETSEYDGHFVDWENKKWIDFEGTGKKPIITKITSKKWNIEFKGLGKSVTFNSIGGLNSHLESYQFYYLPMPTLQWVIPSISPWGDILSDNATEVSLNVTGKLRNTTTFYIYNTTHLIQNITYQAFGNGTYLYNHTFTNLRGNNFTIDAIHTIETGSTINATRLFLYRVFLDNCTDSSDVTLNFKIFNEEYPPSFLNSSLEIDGSYWFNNISETINYHMYFNRSHTYDLCFYPNNITFYTDAYIKYKTNNGFSHRYYLVNQSLNSTIKNITMYNFDTQTDISDLKITARYKDNYTYYENIIAKLQRRYVSEGVWRTVQMDKAGDYGLLFFNIKEEDTDYKIIFQDGFNQVVKTTESMKFVCSSGICELTFLLDPYSTISIGSEISHDWDYDNETGLINLTWLNADGDSSTVNLLITKETMTGTATICDITQTAAAGNIGCNVTAYTGSVLLSFNGDSTDLLTEWVALKTPNLGSILTGAESAFWTFGIMLTIVMFGIIISPVAGIVVMVFGLIMILFLGIFTPITVTFIIIAAVLGTAIGIKVQT